MRMAGERGWIPMSSSLLSRSYLADHWRLVEEGARRSGAVADRSRWRIARDILVAPTRAAARDRARAVLGRNYVQHQHPNRVGTVQMTSTKLDPALPDEAVTVDYLMENIWIVGDPAECVDKINQLYEESGGFGGLLTITTDSDDASGDHESLRPLMEEVAPRVAALGGARAARRRGGPPGPAPSDPGRGSRRRRGGIEPADPHALSPGPQRRAASRPGIFGA